MTIKSKASFDPENNPSKIIEAMLQVEITKTIENGKDIVVKRWKVVHEGEDPLDADEVNEFLEKLLGVAQDKTL